MSQSLDIDRRVRRYWILFVALVALTGVNLLLYNLDLAAHTKLTLGLGVAVVQAGIILAGFMGLIGERRLIVVLLAFTSIFFLAVLLLPSVTSIKDQASVATTTPSN